MGCGSSTPDQEVKVLLVGLDGAGKTTMMMVCSGQNKNKEKKNHKHSTQQQHHQETHHDGDDAYADGNDSDNDNDGDEMNGGGVLSVPVTEPTLGFNMFRVQCRTVLVKVWDLGGQRAFRDMWAKYDLSLFVSLFIHSYFHGADGILFAVDSTDSERFPESARELCKVLSSETLKC
eukprot:TRINITY_DN585_c0_g1_i12.p1 TRINITY_DN585_c0_g1~~TRINITY_DN585_c0_g1_i12.p1  ORF type:complete len:176 (-),score=38.21 TRINITY_DN585_c0_g1_i12:92-619(-)